MNLNEMFSMVEDRENFIDLLLKMLAYLPEDRITAREALDHPFFADLKQSEGLSGEVETAEQPNTKE